VEFLQEVNATVGRRTPGVVTLAEESTAWDGVTRRTDHGGLGFDLKSNMGWMHDHSLLSSGRRESSEVGIGATTSIPSARDHARVGGRERLGAGPAL
jgi:hypothetical protein